MFIGLRREVKFSCKAEKGGGAGMRCRSPVRGGRGGPRGAGKKSTQRAIEALRLAQLKPGQWLPPTTATCPSGLRSSTRTAKTIENKIRNGAADLRLNQAARPPGDDADARKLSRGAS